MADILVLGATARYLHRHPQRRQTASSNSTTHRPFTFAVSGRSPSKLNELVASLGLEDDVEVIVADTRYYEEVERAVKRAKVVINCVGPYWKYSLGVARACAANSVHYVDINGETHFEHEIIKRYEYLAYKHSSIVIPSCGVDSIPSDILVYLAASTLRKALASPSPGPSNAFSEAPSALIASSVASMKMQVTSPSGGSLATAISMLEDVPREVEREIRAVDCLSPVKKQKAALNSPYLIYTLTPASSPRSLPLSLSKVTTSSGKKAPFTRWGSFSFFAPHNHAMVMRSWGLLERESAGRCRDAAEHHSHEYNGDPSDGTNSPVKDVPVKTYGLDFTYNEFLHADGPIRALAASLIMLSFRVALTFIPLLRWIYKKVWFKPGEGPNEESMKNGSLFATNITTSIPIQSDKHKKARPYIVQTTMEFKYDPGYLGTAMMASEAALSLLHIPSLPPLAQHGGFLTPATALGDVIVQRLSDVGFWEVGSAVVQA